MKTATIVPVEPAAAEDIKPTEVAEKPPDKPEKPDKPKAKDPEIPRDSTTIKSIRAEEEKSLKEWLDSIGVTGAFQVQIHRHKPEHVMINGKSVDTKGHLETVEDFIDEEYLKRQHGGGTYYLKVATRGSEGESFQYRKGFHRTVTIAGDPRVDRLPGNAPMPATAATQGSDGGPAVAKLAPLAPFTRGTPLGSM